MSGAKRQTVKKVNRSQPAQILKQKQKNRVRALLAEQRRSEEMRRQFEAFLASQAAYNNNNNSPESTIQRGRSRKTRRLRR